MSDAGIDSPMKEESLDRASTTDGTNSNLSAAAQPFIPTGESSPSRPVKAMPAKSKTLKGSNSYLPVQAKVPKTVEEKENTKRLIVILSKVG
jgi:hypothetical protein